MNQLLSEAYLDYLEPLVGAENVNNNSYRDLLRMMLDKKFVWFVPNDDNRMVDGLDIRAEWFDKTNYTTDLGPCSFLEVLIGLSRRMEFLTDESADGWAWQLVTNLGLHKMRDPLGKHRRQKVDDILETVIWRLYHPDGSGGFFPLSWPREDQRKVELWYQLNAYVGELSHTS